MEGTEGGNKYASEVHTKSVCTARALERRVKTRTSLASRQGNAGQRGKSAGGAGGVGSGQTKGTKIYLPFLDALRRIFILGKEGQE